MAAKTRYPASVRSFTSLDGARVVRRTTLVISCSRWQSGADCAPVEFVERIPYQVRVSLWRPEISARDFLAVGLVLINPPITQWMFLGGDARARPRWDTNDFHKLGMAAVAARISLH